jgi:hypothetical protein
MAGLSIAVVLLAVAAECRCCEDGGPTNGVEMQIAARSQRRASYHSFEDVPGRVIDSVCCIEGNSCAARRSRGGGR